MKFRINKFISCLGISSRRKAEILIQEGKIKINDKVITDLNYQVDTKDDILTFQKKKYQYKKNQVIAFNKPTGFLCSHQDSYHKYNTIFKILPKEFSHYYICGRLDLDSRGLCILSSDGSLANEIMHPSKKIDKEYIILLNKNIDNFNQISFTMKKGFFCQNQFLKFKEIYKISNRKVRVLLSEGKKRQIRRMFYKVGFEVLDLKRVKVGKFSLKKSPIAEGNYKIITRELIF